MFEFGNEFSGVRDNFSFNKEFIVNGGNFEPLTHRDHCPFANADRWHVRILSLNANLRLLGTGHYSSCLHFQK